MIFSTNSLRAHTKLGLTFTCFTSRLSGVLIVMQLTLEMLACTRTTGRISEESLISSSMSESNAPSGKRKISFKPMEMVAETNTDASILMGGKNKNIIP